MQIIPILLGLLATYSAASTADHIRNHNTDTHEDDTPVISPRITHRDTSCTSSDFYGKDEPSDMCGPSNFTSLTHAHCNIGDASLVNDCSALVADIKGLNGGGFRGMVQKGTLVIASHGTCTFHIEHKEDHSYQFSIGTEDMIDIVTSAIETSGIAQECKGQKMMAATGVMSCTYKGTTVDHTWWIEGPNAPCD